MDLRIAGDGDLRLEGDIDLRLAGDLDLRWLSADLDLRLTGDRDLLRLFGDRDLRGDRDCPAPDGLQSNGDLDLMRLLVGDGDLVLDLLGDLCQPLFAEVPLASSSKWIVRPSNSVLFNLSRAFSIPRRSTNSTIPFPFAILLAVQ